MIKELRRTRRAGVSTGNLIPFLFLTLRVIAFVPIRYYCADQE